MSKKAKQPVPHFKLCGRTQKTYPSGLYPLRPVCGTGTDPLCVRLAGGKECTGSLAQSFRSLRPVTLGLDGGMDRHRQHRPVFCGTHVYSYRRFPYRPEHPAYCHGPRAEAAPGILYGKSVRASQETD